MSAIQAAIEALKATVISGESDNHVREAFDRVTSFLILLNSSSPSPQAIRKLCSVLRQPLQPLYAASLEPTLQLSSAVLSQILGERLPDACRVGDTVSCAEWDATANVILAGVLDFLDHNFDGNPNYNLAVARFFYPVINRFFFPDVSKDSPELSVQLCISAYNILSDTAVGQTANLDLLRDRAVLGGQRLGAAISFARDYLVIEALLTLFARLIPPTNNNAQGKSKRAKFVKEVLGSPKLFKCNTELLDIMHQISSTNWDDTAARIVDALARTDITYPQTFALDEINACGCSFPQPTDADRLVMDKQGFLANVILANSDICDSLQILYAHVRTVTVDTSERVPDGKVLITVDLTAPPLVADVAMNVPAGKPFHLTLLLDREDLSRFMEALRRRGVGKLNFINSTRKTVKARQAISLATEVRFAESSSPLPLATSFEDKIRHVEEVYETDMGDLATSNLLTVEDTRDVVPSASGNSQGQPPCVTSNIPSGRGQSSSTLAINAMELSPETKPRTRSLSVASIKELEENHPPETLPVSHRRQEGRTKRRVSPRKTSVNKRRIKRKLVVGSDDEVAVGPPATDINGGTIAAPGQNQVEVDHGYIHPRAPSNHADFAPESDHPQAPDNLPKDEEDEHFPCDEGMTVMLSDFTVSKPFGGMDTQPTGDVKAALASEGREPIKDREPAPALQQPLAIGRARRGRKAKVPDKELASTYKLAGSRRKREAVKPSNGAVAADSDDKNEYPNKRTRKADCQDTSATDKYLNGKPSPEPSTRTPARATKRYGKKTKGLSPIVILRTVDFDEVPGGPTRFSGNLAITKATGQAEQAETRAKTGRGKNGKRAFVKRPPDVELGQSGAAHPLSHPQDAIENVHAVSAQKRPDVSQTIIAMKSSPSALHSFALDLATNAEDVVMDSHENEAKREPRESSRADVGFKKAAREEILSAAQSKPSKPSETEEPGRVEEGPLPVVSLYSDATGTEPKDEYIEYSVLLNDSEALVEAFDPPVRELTPRKEVTTIDLTLDDSPIHGQLEYANVDLATEKVTQPTAEAALTAAVKRRTDVTNAGITGDMTEGLSPLITRSPPRRKRLSVTFASPIGNVVSERSQSKMTRRAFETRCVQTDTVTEYAHGVDYETPVRPNNTVDGLLGTLPRIKCTPPHHNVGLRFTPLKNVSAKHEMDMTSKDAARKTTDDDVDVREIVDVLNDIRDVIAKGISKKLSNVKRDVRVARDQLVREVLDDLQDMAATNVQQFSALVSLEEGYYKYRKNAASQWEGLIKCNESILQSFENALKEHDQSISARIFPPSLLPSGPLFPACRQRA